MKAVIQAGGKGTRLSKITKDEIPKPMVNLLGKPLLYWQIMKLKENQIMDIIIIIGHLGDKIKDFFGDGSDLGVRISYIKEKTPLGTAGAIFYLSDFIDSKDFIFVYADVYFDIDIKRMVDFHIRNNGLATLFVHPNSHPYDSDLVILDKSNKVVGFNYKSNLRETWYDNCVNSGIYIFSNKILRFLDKPEKMDLEKELLSLLIQKNEDIFAYKSTEYVKDAGTIDRLLKVEEDLKRGYCRLKNLSNKQKCIFIDRDGTVNIYKGLIYKDEDFKLEEGVVEAIKEINNSDFLCILVTNQPVVARGLCSEIEVVEIHNKMSTILGEQGVYFDDIVFCPHHPDKGYEGENPEYKIDCDCRKPKIGMIEKLQKKYNIDLSGSWFIGDTTTDIKTGINAGMKTGLVLTGEAGKDNKYNVEPDLVGKNLFEIIKKIIATE